MITIIEGFGALVGYIFILLVVGIIWDKVFTAFRGGSL